MNYKFLLLSLPVLVSIRCLAQTAIDTTEMLRIGGINQVVNIQGEGRSKPLLLFITGGPGSEGIYEENKGYLGELRKHFTVVAWDQRDCGQTLRLNRSPLIRWILALPLTAAGMMSRAQLKYIFQPDPGKYTFLFDAGKSTVLLLVIIIAFRD